MIVATSIKKAKVAVRKAREQKKKIGFIPTMGALHQGHLRLINDARKYSDFIVVSIFINPLQFGPGEDYDKYRRDYENDEKTLRKNKTDLLFYPSPEVMYPKGFSVYVEETELSRGLCGKSRPGHFRGVCTILAKLFNIIEPDTVHMGQKDYQQALITKRLVEDLNFPIRVRISPLVREKGGLALSSRNAYL
ncbi:MAG: pantoate--beta-alanine ligase, partial [Candidatus Omnitrophica bacterium]|nr:pantoate--beta-alanine ligase [Candidatus Omnitrophota bacterium]